MFGFAFFFLCDYLGDDADDIESTAWNRSPHGWIGRHLAVLERRVDVYVWPRALPSQIRQETGRTSASKIPENASQQHAHKLE